MDAAALGSFLFALAIFFYLVVRHQEYGTLFSWGKCAYCGYRIWASEAWDYFGDYPSVKEELRDRQFHHSCYHKLVGPELVA